MPQPRKSNRLAGVIVGLLVLQYLLGMLANMYAEIPAKRPYEVFEQFGFIQVHVYTGLLLLILAIVFLVLSIRDNMYKAAAVGGLASMAFAFACGELFVFTQFDPWSLLMSLGFLGAFASYLRVLFKNAGDART
ncbi:MAG TPA: hypothetical protein VNG90_00680 [Candidatus Acidoferrum sp.]|nr:hypothetical protein [Candidatus Acidoferrum sp.]